MEFNGHEIPPYSADTVLGELQRGVPLEVVEDLGYRVEQDPSIKITRTTRHPLGNRAVRSSNRRGGRRKTERELEQEARDSWLQ